MNQMPSFNPAKMINKKTVIPDLLACQKHAMQMLKDLSLFKLHFKLCIWFIYYSSIRPRWFIKKTVIPDLLACQKHAMQMPKDLSLFKLHSKLCTWIKCYPSTRPRWFIKKQLSLTYWRAKNTPCRCLKIWAFSSCILNFAYESYIILQSGQDDSLKKQLSLTYWRAKNTPCRCLKIWAFSSCILNFAHESNAILQPGQDDSLKNSYPWLIGVPKTRHADA